MLPLGIYKRTLAGSESFLKTGFSPWRGCQAATATLGSIATRYHVSAPQRRHTGDAWTLSALPQAGPGLPLLLFLRFNYASRLVWFPRHQGRLWRVVG